MTNSAIKSINAIIEIQEVMENFVFPNENRTIEEFDENE